MAIPPDPTGGYGSNYIRQVIAREGPAAVRSLQGASRVAVQTIRQNPRIVQAIVRTGSSTALRVAGASSFEAGLTWAGVEGVAATGGALALSEFIVPVAIVCVIVYVVGSCVVYWSSLPPEQRGYRPVSLDTFDQTPLGQTLASSEFGAAGKAAYSLMCRRAGPTWATGLG
jgi:hypothetical protein